MPALVHLEGEVAQPGGDLRGAQGRHILEGHGLVVLAGRRLGRRGEHRLRQPGTLGQAGRQLGQFGWIHEMACPQENVLFVGELLNWRVQKLVLHA